MGECGGWLKQAYVAGNHWPPSSLLELHCPCGEKQDVNPYSRSSGSRTRMLELSHYILNITTRALEGIYLDDRDPTGFDSRKLALGGAGRRECISTCLEALVIFIFGAGPSPRGTLSCHLRRERSAVG